MATQIGGQAQLLLYPPTDAGQVALHGQAKSADLGYKDNRTRSPHGQGPEGDPSVEYALWDHHNTQILASVNGLTLLDVPLPLDMVLSDWTISGPSAAGVRTGFVPDNLSRQHFLMTTVDDTHGQGLSTASAATPPVAYSTATAAASGAGITQTSYSEADFLSNWTIPDNGGWIYDERKYGVFGTDIQPVTTIVMAPDATGVWAAINLDAAISDVAFTEKTTTQHTCIFWGMGAGSLKCWGLLIPWGAGKHGAKLLKSLDGGTTWRIVDRYPYPGPHTIESLSHKSNGRETYVRHRVENGTASFTFGDEHAPWRFRDPEDANGFTSQSGRLGVRWRGGVGAWIINPLVYNAADADGLLGWSSTGPFKLPQYVNHSSNELRMQPHDDGNNNQLSTPDVIATTERHLASDGVSYFIVTRFDATAAGLKKGGQIAPPTVLGVQDIHRANVTITNSTPVDIAANNEVYDVKWNMHKNMRSTEVIAVVRNDHGQWSNVQPNSLMTLKVAQLVDSGSTPFVVQAVGTLSKILLSEDAQQYIGKGNAQFHFSDFAFRLSKKKCRDFPAFGGWGLADALTYVCQSCGIHSKFYDFSSISPGWILDSPAYLKVSGTNSYGAGRGHETFKYTDQQTPLTAMDEMCASKGFVWGITGPGVVTAWRPGQFNSSYTYNLSDSNYDPRVDCIRSLTVDVDLADFFNHVTMYGKKVSGEECIARWNDQASWLNTGAINYIGDDWWWTGHAPAGAQKPDAFAAARLAELAQYDRIVSWTTDLGQRALMPNNQVNVNVSGLNIPTGQSFEVIEKRGHVNEDLTGTLEFILGLPQKKV